MTDKIDWDVYPKHLRPSEPPEEVGVMVANLKGVKYMGIVTGRLSSGAPNARNITGEEGKEPDPKCPECAYEKETGRLASTPHHCDQEKD